MVRGKKTCHRRVCPVCYHSWITREAGKASDDLVGYAETFRRKIVHWIISPPQDTMYLDTGSYSKMKKSVYKVLKKIGFRGGCVIFHERAVRYQDGSYSELHEGSQGPHFHVVGDGWLNHEAASPYRNDGWIVKNKGVRKSIFSTLTYLLEHASVGESTLPQDEDGNPAIRHSSHVKVQAVTWIGTMANNRPKPWKIRRFDGNDTIHCPICDKDLPTSSWSVIDYFGSYTPPDRDHFFLILDNPNAILTHPLTVWSGFYN